VRDLDPFASPVLFRCPIWLRAQVSKQISCSTISVLILPQRITVRSQKDIKSSLVYEACAEQHDFSLITNYSL